MFFLQEFIPLFSENKTAIFICGGYLIFLCFALILSVYCGGERAFSAWHTLSGGVVTACVFACNMTMRASCVWIACLYALGGIFQLILLACMAAKQKRKLRAARREEELRTLRFTLPDKDNSYVRARLNSVLQEKPVADADEKPSFRAFDLAYAQKLSQKLKEAPLTFAERMQAEELSKLFRLYGEKRQWSVGDGQTLNEAFSALLKLSAKYAV